MNILNIKDNCLVMALNRNDLDIFGLDYDSLDYSSESTKKVIRLALDCASEKYGDTNIYEKGMLIEAVPDTDGGCLLFFTFTPPGGKKQLVRENDVTYIAESPDIENICALSKALYAMNAAPYSSLYKKNGLYRLVISSHSGFGLDGVITEFANCVPACRLPETMEYWTLTTSENALEKLSAAAM